MDPTRLPQVPYGPRFGDGVRQEPSMERRTFMVLVSGGLLAAPLAAGAQQQAGKLSRSRLGPFAKGFVTSATSKDRTSSSTGGINWAKVIACLRWPRSWSGSSRMSLSRMSRWPSAPPCRRPRPSLS